MSVVLNDAIAVVGKDARIAGLIDAMIDTIVAFARGLLPLRST